MPKLVVCPMTFSPINLLFLDYLLFVIVDGWGQVGNKRKEGLEKVQRFQKDNIYLKCRRLKSFYFFFI